MEDELFDVAILGGGPGGYPAAIMLAQNGVRVALIEQKDVGGTCLNRGCIPTKALIANAEMVKECQKVQNQNGQNQHGKEFGISIQGMTIDFGQMVKRKDTIVERLKKSLESLIQSNAITVIPGKGVFRSTHTIEVGGKKPRLIRAKHCIIATGSEPKEIAAFPFDGTHIHSSTSILEQKTLPKQIAIVGAGAIGCEFASLFRNLGVTVTLIEALDRILPLECPTISQALMPSFQKRGMSILVGSQVQSVTRSGDGILVRLSNDKTVAADIALIAIGRSLNSAHLGLEAIGIRLDRGSIVVNDRMETSIPHIFAVGDVTGKSLYAHAATHQGFVAAHNILGKPARMHYHAIPGVIFTDPEVGVVGLSLDAALKQGFDAIRTTYPLQALGKAQAAGQTEGFTQLVVDKKSGQILGAQVVGHEAGILLQEITLAIENELTVECLSQTIHPHPTLAEGWMEAALIAEGHPLHFPPPKRR